MHSPSELVVPVRYRIMTQNHLVSAVFDDSIVLYPLKAGLHFLRGLVVVAEDKEFFTFQLVQSRQTLGVFPREIAENVHLVVMSNRVVPIPHKGVVHFHRIGKGSAVMLYNIFVP